MSKNLKPKQPRLTYIAFLECELRGKWEDWIDEAIDKQGVAPEDLGLDLGTEAAKNFRASQEGCELWIVRPDLLRRSFVFKKGSEITISGATVRFYQGAILEELSIDEEQHAKL